LITALTVAVSGGAVIAGRVGNSFSNIASVNVDGISLPVLYLLIAMVGIGYWLERTGSGRRMYAVGFDQEASRLSGLRVGRSTMISLVFSASLAGFAGLVLAGRLAAGSPDAGPAYLIPAFSAAFLGATQLRGGRFNPWGTVIGVMMIGTGDLGLVLTGGPTWTTQLFEGLVLIVAVAASGADKRAIIAKLRSMRQTAPVGVSRAGDPPS
jgi:ribose transport system permease protein